MKAMGVREEQLSDHTDNLNVIPQNEEGSRTNGDPYIQDIAVIGLSGRYPGADHVDELWENVKPAGILLLKCRKIAGTGKRFITRNAENGVHLFKMGRFPR